MGTREEQTVQAFLDLWGDGEAESPDIDRIVPMFSQDAVWQLWVPGGPTIVGREAIRADIHRQLTFSTHMQCGPARMASTERVVFTERSDHFTSGTTRVEHRLVAVFEIDEDGLISAWREYFDLADVDRQIRSGFTPPAG